MEARALEVHSDQPSAGIIDTVDSFRDILRNSASPVGTATLLMLAWIASCDGEICDSEMNLLQELAAGACTPDQLRLIIRLTTPCQPDDLQSSLDYLRGLEPNRRRQTLHVALIMALRDGFVTSAEGHIIRFLADLLLTQPNDLDVMFRELTGESFPPPSDPSNPWWWDNREQRSRKSQSNQQRQSENKSYTAPPQSTLQRLRDLAVLGLDDKATASDIKDAYRRLAQVHHPDKFTALGPEAVKSAEIAFQRIRSAYDRLGAS